MFVARDPNPDRGPAASKFEHRRKYFLLKKFDLRCHRFSASVSVDHEDDAIERAADRAEVILRDFIAKPPWHRCVKLQNSGMTGQLGSQRGNHQCKPAPSVALTEDFGLGIYLNVDLNSVDGTWISVCKLRYGSKPQSGVVWPQRPRRILENQTLDSNPTRAG